MKIAAGTAILLICFVLVYSCKPFAGSGNKTLFNAKRIQPGGRSVDLKGKVCVITFRIFTQTGKELYIPNYLSLIGLTDTICYDSLSKANPLRQMLDFNQEDDSSVFRLCFRDFFPASGYKTYTTLSPGDTLVIGMRTLRVMGLLDFQKLRFSENISLNKSIGSANSDTSFNNLVVSMRFTPEQQVFPGLFKQGVEEGTGPVVSAGEKVLLFWKGSFLNGQVFDNNENSGGFEYVIGTPEQLLLGLQQGVRTMRNGERAIFLLHPSLAFGEKGSITGLVPPNKSVIFELFLKKQKP